MPSAHMDRFSTSKDPEDASQTFFWAQSIPFPFDNPSGGYSTNDPLEASPCCCFVLFCLALPGWMQFSVYHTAVLERGRVPTPFSQLLLINRFDSIRFKFQQFILTASPSSKPLLLLDGNKLSCGCTLTTAREVGCANT